MRNDPEVEAIAMQWVLDYEHQRGWQPQDINNRDGSGFDIRSVGPADPETGKSPVRWMKLGRAVTSESFALREWVAQSPAARRLLLALCRLGLQRWSHNCWWFKPSPKLVGDAKEIKQVTRYLVGLKLVLVLAGASAKIQAASFRDCHGTVQPVAVPSYRWGCPTLTTLCG